MEKDIFKFDDFVTGGKLDDLQKMKSNLVKEGLFSDREGYNDEEDDDSGIFTGHIQRQDGEDDEEINQEFNPYKVPSSEIEDEDDDDFGFESPFCKPCEGTGCEECDGSGMKRNPVVNNDYKDRSMHNPYYDEDDNEELEDLDESKSESEEYYKLFKDKAEDFVCDIAVEGVNQNDTEVRLIIESEDWTLMFVGEIKKGKCIIPIKKLGIFNEGQTGNIKLEVNADGNLFTPWEDKFVVKVSKKVTVKLNESKSSKPKAPVKKSLGVKVNVRK
jgi:hypothetical protein